MQIPTATTPITNAAPRPAHHTTAPAALQHLLTQHHPPTHLIAATARALANASGCCCFDRNVAMLTAIIKPIVGYDYVNCLVVLGPLSFAGCDIYESQKL